jgi:hypothetical membrane protein
MFKKHDRWGTRMSENQDNMKQRIGAASGILSPIIAFSCILIAIASYPAFSWMNNALSDLGVISGITEMLFNFGLCASGILGFTFALLGLLTCIGKNWISKIGVVIYAAATVALVAIGVFNESYTGTHFAVSVAFFMLMPMALFIITCGYYLSQKRRMAIFTGLTGIAAALPWVLLFAFGYVPNVAIPEFISGLAVSVWNIAISYRIVRQVN